MKKQNLIDENKDPEKQQRFVDDSLVPHVKEVADNGGRAPRSATTVTSNQTSEQADEEFLGVFWPTDAWEKATGQARAARAGSRFA